jgi:hypothetical protein
MRPTCGAVLLALASTAAADVVELKNGSSLEGVVVEETADSVTLRMEGGQVTFPMKLVAGIKRMPLPEKEPPPGEKEEPAAAAPKDASAVVPAPEDWAVLWTPDRRAGWVHLMARVDPKGAVFEWQVAWLDAEGNQKGTSRLVEENGPRLEPVSVLYMETGTGREVTRTARVVEGRLRVENWTKGEKTETSHPLPPGFRFPLAARATALGRPRVEGWQGTSYDAREGRFFDLAVRAVRVEKAEREGRTVDAVVLVRDRAGVREEERVGPDGRVITADLDGPALVAVGSTKERVEAFRAGTARETSEEEKRARTAFVSPEDGFRIVKPGASWTFVPAASLGEARRLLLKDPTGAVTLAIDAEDVPGAPPPAAQLGVDLEERIRKASTGYRKIEDGYVELAGRNAYRLLCDAKVEGDSVRILAHALAHRGRAWTFTATAPRANWNEVRPYLERILAGFEWL